MFIYDLNIVVNHEGESSRDGHFTASLILRNNKYVTISDDKVQNENRIDEILKQDQIYFCLYVLREVV